MQGRPKGGKNKYYSKEEKLKYVKQMLDGRSGYALRRNDAGKGRIERDPAGYRGSAEDDRKLSNENVVPCINHKFINSALRRAGACSRRNVTENSTFRREQAPALRINF